VNKQTVNAAAGALLLAVFSAIVFFIMNSVDSVPDPKPQKKFQDQLKSYATKANEAEGKGETLFNAKCSTCHSPSDEFIGKLRGKIQRRENWHNLTELLAKAKVAKGKQQERLTKMISATAMRHEELDAIGAYLVRQK
jgi:cytochrome c5